MRYDFAPLEGITGHIYRNLHHRFFPGVDQYYTPFLSPTMHHKFTGSELQDILPEHNKDVFIVPQILTKSAADFSWAAGELEAMGYNQVNLNLGCPSGTVVAKGKGAGMLANLPALEVFLNEIFEQCSLKISVKTRLGKNDPEEFQAVLELLNRYPIYELIVHPRVQKDFYKYPVRIEFFRKAAKNSKNPLCYNGDLKTSADCAQTAEQFPHLRSLMLGRGLVANPNLVTEMKYGTILQKDTLHEFHDCLLAAYREAFQNDRNAICRMKECWQYMLSLFENQEKAAKALRKAVDLGSYQAAVSKIFQERPFLSIDKRSPERL